MPDEPQQFPFEQGLEKLEGIVKQLEDGETALEQSLQLFEEGVQLSNRLRKQLDDAESKVEILTKKDGGYAPKAFDVDEAAPF